MAAFRCRTDPRRDDEHRRPRHIPPARAVDRDGITRCRDREAGPVSVAAAGYRRSPQDCRCRAVIRGRLAAISASYARVAGFRPDARNDAATVEIQYVEVRLRLLQMRLTRRALLVGLDHVRPNRQFRQRDHTYDRLVRKRRGIGDPPEQDDRRRVDHASRRVSTHHSDGSASVSISRRSASGSTRGNCLRRAMSSAGPALRRGSGRSSATARPSVLCGHPASGTPTWRRAMVM